MKKILVYGFGNPGRQDDGLGPELVDMVENWKNENDAVNVHTDSNYQLNIEDSGTIAEFDVVIFADASSEQNLSDVFFEKISPSNAEVKYTLHAASPGYIVKLCNELYDKFPQCYLLHIKGYEWDLAEGITPSAKLNLQKAFDKTIKEIQKFN